MSIKRAMPEGYNETQAVVKALQAFADEAKRRRPQRADHIEMIVDVAQRAMWHVYGFGDDR